MFLYGIAASQISAKNRDHPLELSASDLSKSIDVNVMGAYVAAQEAAASFEASSADDPNDSNKTFIFTGNRLNIAPIPPLLSLGVGKAATAHMMAFLSETYKARGWKYEPTPLLLCLQHDPPSPFSHPRVSLEPFY